MQYGLIGEKLGHSFSAEIHARLGGYTYILQELQQEELDDFFTRRDFTGINVTIPYKQEVIPYLDIVDETALRIGTVNTVVNRDGKLHGYNTDFYGLRALIQHNGFSLRDKTVLILGSGGTSKTAVAVAEDLGCRCAVRVSRTAKDGGITYQQAAAEYTNAHYIINTTPCGMYPNNGETPIDLADYPDLEGVIDVVFNPLRTKLVCDALACGIPAVGGLYMLVAQAARAMELFTGVSADITRIDAIYNDLLHQKENVVLIGMPSCGKTTVGQLLAKRWGRNMVDTDALIEESEGSIPDLFAEKGEAYFRDAESAAIQQIAAYQSTVIATGGGAILRRENVQSLKQNGRLVFLDRSPERLIATADRPLSSDHEALKKRFEERYDIYRTVCDLHITADGTAEQVARQIEEVITGENAAFCGA